MIYHTLNKICIIIKSSFSFFYAQNNIILLINIKMFFPSYLIIHCYLTLRKKKIQFLKNLHMQFVIFFSGDNALRCVAFDF